MLLFLFLGLLIILFVIGIPVGYALGITSVVVLIFENGLFEIPYQILAQRMLYGINNFTLLAVPFFIFAGKLMNTGGITKRIFKFASSLVGHWKGGLGHVNVIASIIFSGMSGSASSDAAGLGLIEVQAMDDAGYDKDFACAITASSSTIGPVIPPSVPMVFYGVAGGVSIGSLFLAGIIPGLLMALSLMIMIFFIAKKNNYPSEDKFTFKERLLSFKEAFLPLGTPLIILGGIYTGKLTPTESSVVAVLWALFLSFVIYKELTLKELWGIMKSTMHDTVAMSFIIACSFIYGWLLVRSGIPTRFAELILSITTNRYVFLLIMNGFLLVAGFFIDTTVGILIFTPMIMPLLSQMGVDPIHFGIIMILNLMIGLITPPFGMILFVLARITKRPFEEVMKATAPFIIPLAIVLLIITFVPELALFIPRLAMRG